MDGGTIPCILVENKADLLKEDNSEIDDKLEEFGVINGFCGTFRTSAKTGLNISESIEYLIMNITRRIQAIDN